MKNKIQNKIDELEKEIEQTKIYSMENREVNKTAFYEANRRVIFLGGKLKGYKEAQKLMDEMLTQTNLRNYSREHRMKKRYEEKLKNIIDEIDDLRGRKYHVHYIDECDCCVQNVRNIERAKQIIQKHYSVRVKGRAPDASQSTSNKRDTGNPDTLLDDFCEELKEEMKDVDNWVFNYTSFCNFVNKLKQKHLGDKNEK